MTLQSERQSYPDVLSTRATPEEMTLQSERLSYPDVLSTRATPEEMTLQSERQSYPDVFSTRATPEEMTLQSGRTQDKSFENGAQDRPQLNRVHKPGNVDFILVFVLFLHPGDLANTREVAW